MKPCSVTSGTYMAILRRIFLRRRWWIMAVPVVACGCLIGIDTRFAYVALIIAMAVVMLALPLVYYYGLTQESRWSILEKTVTTTAQGINLEFTGSKLSSQFIAWSDIQSTTVASECLVLRLKKNNYTFLALPFTAFDGKEDLRDFVLTVRRNLSH